METENNMDQDIFLRQLGFGDLSNISISLVGCGSVGSCVGIILSKMGIRDFTIYDFDNIETHNIPNQFFTNDEVGFSKVEAVSDRMSLFSPYSESEGITINAINDKFKQELANRYLTNYYMVTVDSFQARLEVLDIIRSTRRIESDREFSIIDGRSGGDCWSTYYLHYPTCSREHEKSYIESLHEIPIDLPCSYRSIMFNVMFLASHMSSLVWKTEQEHGNIPLKTHFHSKQGGFYYEF